MDFRLVQAAVALVLLTSCNRKPYLPEGSFAGCYLAHGAQRLRLSPDGVIFADGEKVGTYKTLAPVDGKHGPLVEASGLAVTSHNGEVLFKRGSTADGYFWSVTGNGLNVVFEPDNEIKLAKAPDIACR